MKGYCVVEFPHSVYRGKEITECFDTRYPLAFLSSTYKVDDKEFWTLWGAKRYIRKLCREVQQ